MEFRRIGFEGILLGKNEYPYTGSERQMKSKNENIIHYKGQDSNRFIYIKNNKAVSGLHLLTFNGKLVVESVITLEDERQKGYAKSLFKYAKNRFKCNIQHSSKLSELGRIFAERVN